MANNDNRKNPPERRLNERRKHWEGVKQLGPDSDFWKFESRRKYGYDQRKKPDKRAVKDRRRGERRKKERRGDPLSRSPHSGRYLSPQVAEARAALGGGSRRLKLGTGLDLSGPTPIYKPPVPASVRQDAEKIDLSVFEKTFPGFLLPLRSAGRALKQGWHWFFPKKRS